MQEEYVPQKVHDANMETLAVAIDGANRRVDDLRSETADRIADLKDSINRSLVYFTIAIGIMQIGLAVLLYLLPH